MGLALILMIAVMCVDVSEARRHSSKSRSKVAAHQRKHMADHLLKRDEQDEQGAKTEATGKTQEEGENLAPEEVKPDAKEKTDENPEPKEKTDENPEPKEKT